MVRHMDRASRVGQASGMCQFVDVASQSVIQALTHCCADAHLCWRLRERSHETETVIGLGSAFIAPQDAAHANEVINDLCRLFACGRPGSRERVQFFHRCAVAELVKAQQLSCLLRLHPCAEDELIKAQ